jgi:hypothetical protein
VKGEVDQPFGEPANPGAPITPVRPMPAQPNPLNETPFGEPAVPPKPATPSTPPAASETEGQGGSARALGNVLKRAFGGFMPSLPEVPSGLPLGSGDSSPPPQDNGQAPANPPAATPGANANENPFGAPATPPAKPAPATNENPFEAPATPPAKPAPATNENPFDN